jgi:hypothetical protein
VSDRETIKNALNLNNIPAADFMTKTDGAKIENFGNNVSKVFSDEVAALKDELYQLRAELAKQGLVNDYGVYSGFQDYFKSNDIRYSFDSLGGINSMPGVNTIVPSIPGQLKVGDWFVICKKPKDAATVSNTEYFVAKATVINVNGTVSFETVTSPINPIDTLTYNVELLKIAGQYNNGSFSFSTLSDTNVTDKEKYTMLNDDSKTAWRQINASKTGYAVSFRVPDMTIGALKGISVMARRTQAPGSLICYCLEENAESLAATDIVPIAKAKSNAVAYDKLPNAKENQAFDTGTKIDFLFQKADGSFFELEKDKRYIFVFVTETADSNNFWEIEFGVSNIVGNPDLQTNNKTYEYAAGVVLKENNTLGDVIFVLATLEIKTNVETPLIEGLYTSQTVNIANASNIARARVTLRVNREGYYTVTNASPEVANGETVEIDPSDSINVPLKTGFVPNDTVVIGSNIRKVISTSPYSVGVDKGLYVNRGEPVYKVGYKVFIHASKKVWNQTTKLYDSSNDQLIEMPLVCVMPDIKRASKLISDRLVFECEFRDPTTEMPLDVNTFDLQIVWNTHFSNAELQNSPSLIGRIHDLSLSLDRTL